MRSVSSILASPRAYALWQAPFARAKLGPLLRRNEFAAARHVLDIGCGPGTNVSYFGHANYLGLDLSAPYVAYAQKRYKRDFRVQDVCDFAPTAGNSYDFVLANSLFHHLTDQETRSVLAVMAQCLSPDGHVHIVDLVLSEGSSIARYLALHDRGRFPRSTEAWSRLFNEAFEPVIFEPYSIGWLGISLWHLVYFKGRRKT